MQCFPLHASHGVARGSADASLGKGLIENFRTGKCIAQKSADLLRVTLSSFACFSFFSIEVC